ncbi:MAG: hypothetical protein RIF36_11995 [Imperialibacter sp.]|uniref:hypothetical protein n=1 Tax=Imperialibacter sp. TaxID=2038411 RepID=UPI0032ECDF6D
MRPTQSLGSSSVNKYGVGTTRTTNVLNLILCLVVPPPAAALSVENLRGQRLL